MKTMTRHHVEIAKKYLSDVAPDDERAAREILECVAEQYLTISSVMGMLSPEALRILDDECEKHRRQAKERDTWEETRELELKGYLE